MALAVKNLHAKAGDAGDDGSIPRLGGLLGGGNGHPLQYSCLENPMDGGVYSSQGCKKLDTTEAGDHACKVSLQRQKVTPLAVS